MTTFSWVRGGKSNLNWQSLPPAAGTHHFPRISLSADALFGDTHYKELLNWTRCHRLVGRAAGHDAPGDSSFVRTIGNASHLAPGLPGRAGDKLQCQASIVVVWHAS